MQYFAICHPSQHAEDRGDKTIGKIVGQDKTGHIQIGTGSYVGW